ncbi:MAG: Lipid II flippase MurJ [Candidatus Anoxychlamydiales bacterium]|nr:Lipid II flippase MurJ [Candidatus Anoxychlamydiales bacterium]
MSIDSSVSITKSFKNFFLGTFFSRISGLLRDVLMAFFFGASAHVAAFMVAYRFANLFRRLIGEASLQAGFIPHYENLRLEDKKKAAFFYRDLFFSISLLLIGIITFSEIFLFSFTNLNKEIIQLTQIMSFGLLFICLYAINSAFLQCHQSYFLPSIAPVSFNIIWILSCLLFRNLSDEKFVYVLAIFVVIAFLFQYLTTALSSFKIISKELSFKELFKFKLFSPEIKALIKPITLSILGIGAVQINSALDALFATFSEKEGAAYLWYAMRLYQLPLALFAIAISSAILPPLTRAYKTQDFTSFKKFFNLAIAKSFALMFPATICLILIGPSLVNLIFARGSFKLDALINTSYCLYGYAIGLSFASFIMIISQAFYAKKHYFIPTISAVLSVLLNIILNSIFIFIFNMQSMSVAISTSISALFNFLLLSYFLKKRFLKIFDKFLFTSFFKIILCSSLAALATFLIGYVLKDPSIYFLVNMSQNFPTKFLTKINSFLTLSITYITTLFISAYLLKSKEIIDLIFLKNKLA